MSLEAVALQLDEQLDLSTSLETNESNFSRVADFWTFVAENSDVIVESPRLPGVEMPFGALMSMCAATVTEQNVDKFYTESYALLAAARAKAEQPEEENEAKEETEKTGDKTSQTTEISKPDKNTRGNQQEIGAANEEAPSAKPLPVSADSKQETRTAKVVSSDAELGANYSSIGIAVSPLETVKASVPKKASAKAPSPQDQSNKNPVVIEARAATTGSSYSVELRSPESTIVVTAEAPVPLRISAETHYEPQTSEQVFKPVEVNVAAVVDLEEHGLRFEEEPQTDEQYIRLAPEIKTMADDAKIDLGVIQNNGKPRLQYPADEQYEPFGEFIEPRAPQKQIFDDFTVPGPETLAFSMLRSTEDGPKTTSELSGPVGEVEHTLLQVADRVEQMESQQTKAAHQILNEIVQKIAVIKSPVEHGSKTLEDAAKTEDAEEELKELFIQLFDHVEIEYSPKLIESCVKIALRVDIVELMAKIEQEDEQNHTSHDTGTHEVIKQLLAAISNVKKSIQHAYQIGRTILQLYAFDHSIMRVV